MPELPEVETIRSGLSPNLEGKTIQKIKTYHHQLRYKIPPLEHLIGKKIQRIQRRSKYLIFNFEIGNLLIHLGMSGVLRIYDYPAPEKQKHDHIEFYFDHSILRYHDPRRFGAVLWSNEPIEEHQLIRLIAPEPLSDAFNDCYLYEKLKKSNKPIKLAIMDSHLVCGVGNIYASEALFLANIHPQTIASLLSIKQIDKLVIAIKEILNKAILEGGTTLKDFKNTDGKPGYFTQKLKVYARDGTPCDVCKTPVEKITLGQRSTYFCPLCQII